MDAKAAPGFFSRLFYASSASAHATEYDGSSSSSASSGSHVPVASYSAVTSIPRSLSSPSAPSATLSAPAAASATPPATTATASAAHAPASEAGAPTPSTVDGSSSPSSSRPSSSSSSSVPPLSSSSPPPSSSSSPSSSPKVPRQQTSHPNPFANPAKFEAANSWTSPGSATNGSSSSSLFKPLHSPSAAALPGMIKRVTNSAPPPIAINSPSLKRTPEQDPGKSTDMLPVRKTESTKALNDFRSTEGENSQLHKMEMRFVENGSTKVSPVKIKKFNALLSQPVVDIDALKRESWSGIPPSARDITWKLLLGYLPAKQDRREPILVRKRRDYMESIPQYYKPEEEQSPSEQAIWRQIHVDILRTHQDVALFQQEAVQKILVRILYLWAIRHPASSYVQGINELVIPFFVVFLSTAVHMDDVEQLDINTVPADVVSMVEADSYWCLSALLDGIQDHYTSDQPGIQRLIFKLKELIRRIDLPLHAHLEKQEVHFTLFAFKWMNCLLMRELRLALVTRMWDTYLSEPEGFSTFHVYVCAAFLTLWSDHLRQLEFQDIVLFLHHVPTSEWTTAEIEMLLSKAYMLKALYHDSQAHLK